jgi:hypothetical protein
METMTLTDEQAAAVNAGPMVSVTASAGSGKTRVLIARIAKLISDGADPGKIVAITFTRKAAGEMVRRLHEQGIIIGYCGTVHSWLLKKINECFGIQFGVCPQELFESMVKKSLIDCGSKLSFDSAMENIDDWKYPIENNAVKMVRNKLHAGDLIDYDQILRAASCGEFIEENKRFQDVNLLVDEFQDTGPSERKFYDQINPMSFMIVSDYRQTLYGFRGADAESPARMAELKNMERVELTKNFRCSDDIQEEAALALCGRGNTDALDLPVIASRIAYDHVHGWMPDAILCGTNDTVDRLTKALTDLGLPVVGRSRVTEQQKDLEALIRWKIDPENELLLVNMLRRLEPNLLEKLKSESVEKLCDIGDLFESHLPFGWPIQQEFDKLRDSNPGSSLSELAELAIELPETEGCIVCTIHSAKGLEWDSVVVVDDMGDSDHHRRMRYVAYTRARKNLVVYRMRERWAR